MSKLPTEDSVSSNLRRFVQDAETFDGLESSLSLQFQNEWVAFYNGQVVSHGATLQELLQMLSECGIPPERAIVHFFNPDPPLITT